MLRPKSTRQIGGDDPCGGLLPPCRWSPRTALDPKHRPQLESRPSSTVRREWARFPQEAHLLDLPNKRIRRLTSTEIVRLQGFEPDWFNVPGLSPRDVIRAAGDAVPPPVAKVLLRAITDSAWASNRSFLEICAGSGGLASGAAANGYSAVALIDSWVEACRILKWKKPWPKEVVYHAELHDYNFTRHRDAVGILCGGPPCQPWSSAGVHRGSSDHRDLFGAIPGIVAAVRPDVILLENVPALLSDRFASYLRTVVSQLRSPAAGLRYGLLFAKFNAADFGVPQSRDRVFLLGLRDGYAKDCQRLFDSVTTNASHRNRPWVTVGEVLATAPDPGGWMAWHYETPQSWGLR
jgi:site-specific DNA-cytosine methylase